MCLFVFFIRSWNWLKSASLSWEVNYSRKHQHRIFAEICILFLMSNMQNEIRINKIIFQLLTMLLKNTQQSTLNLSFPTQQRNLLIVTFIQPTFILPSLLSFLLPRSSNRNMKSRGLCEASDRCNGLPHLLGIGCWIFRKKKTPSATGVFVYIS